MINDCGDDGDCYKNLFVQSVSHVTCDMSNAYANPWDMVNNFCFDVYAQKGVFVIMSHVTCLMSNVYVDPWDMLNKFCFYVYAQMSLFMGENDNVFFLQPHPHPLVDQS